MALAQRLDRLGHDKTLSDLCKKFIVCQSVEILNDPIIRQDSQVLSREHSRDYKIVVFRSAVPCILVTHFVSRETRAFSDQADAMQHIIETLIAARLPTLSVATSFTLLQPGPHAASSTTSDPAAQSMTDTTRVGQ